MIILNGVAQKFQAVLASAVNSDQPEFQATFGQLDDGVLDNYATNDGELNSTTDVDIVAGITSKQVGIKTVTIHNRDDAEVTITFKKDISATDRFIYKAVLGVGESVHYESNRGWYCTSAAGGERIGQSESHTGQVTGTSALSLAVAAITAQTALASGLAGTDELIVSDGGVLKRMDITVLETYMEANIALPIGQVSGFTDNSTNWQTAYGWGDHGAVGYLTSQTSHADVLVDGDIGGSVQAYDADLDTWAGITPSANMQSLAAAATYAAMRTLLDLEAGTDFYSKSAADTAFGSFGIQFFISAGADATYVLDQYASFGYTIVDAVAETVTGTITMEVEIDATPVTGISAMAIGTSETTDTASAANVVSAGNTVVLNFTSNVAAVGLSVKLNCTRD